MRGGDRWEEISGSSESCAELASSSSTECSWLTLTFDANGGDKKATSQTAEARIQESIKPVVGRGPQAVSQVGYANYNLHCSTGE